eukprot:972169-Prymnesium_polylepis.2
MEGEQAALRGEEAGEGAERPRVQHVERLARLAQREPLARPQQLRLASLLLLRLLRGKLQHERRAIEGRRRAV